MHKKPHPTVGCNCLSLPLMHASETKIFSYHHDYEFTFVNYCIQYSYKLLVISNIEWYSTAIGDCVKFCVHCPLPRCPPYLLRNWREPIKNFIHGNTSINYDFAHQERIGEDVWVPALVKSLISTVIYWASFISRGRSSGSDFALFSAASRFTNAYMRHYG